MILSGLAECRSHTTAVWEWVFGTSVRDRGPTDAISSSVVELSAKTGDCSSRWKTEEGVRQIAKTSPSTLSGDEPSFFHFFSFLFLCECVAYAFDCRQEPKQTFSNVQNHLECRAKLLTRSLWLSNWLKPKSTRYLLGGVVGVADCGENCFPFWRHYKSVKRHVDCFLRPDQRTSNCSFRCWVLGTYTPDSYTSHFVVPAGSPSSTEDKIYVYDINQPSLPLLSILFLCLFLSLWPFQL